MSGRSWLLKVAKTLCFCVRIRQESLHLMCLDTGAKSVHVLSLKLSQVSYPKTNSWGKQPLLIYFLSLWE